MTPALAISEFAHGDLTSLVALWQRAGLTRPFNDPESDIGFAAAGESSAVLVGRLDAEIVASVMVGHDGHRGAIYYLAVDPDHQRRGLGVRMLTAAESWLKARGVWKLNLMIRPENEAVRDFYLKSGYEIEDRIVMSRRIGNT